MSADGDPGGLLLSLKIDRQKASALGVGVQDIDNALNNAFALRQISIIYTQRNQYRVVLEIDPKFRQDPSNLERIFVSGADGVEVPLSAFVRSKRNLTPLAVAHTQSFPSTTVSFLLPYVPLPPPTSSGRWKSCKCRRESAAASTAMPATSTGRADDSHADPGCVAGDVDRTGRAL